MAIKQKACKQCRIIYSGTKCPKCGSEDGKENFRGKVIIFNAEESQIAKNMNLKEKGEYAIRL